MKPFLNPIFLIRIAKSYLSDVNRIWRYNSEQLKKYQDKALKKVVNYAYTVPLYNKKYKEYGIHPNDIKGIDDIGKLPIITKDDLRNNYPNNIIPKGFNKKNGIILSTSGSTGSPIFVYYDKFTAIKTLESYVRALKAFGGSWKKSKIALLVDMKAGGIEHALFSESISPFLKKFISLDNIKLLHVGKKAETLLKELNEFNPEFIGSDPTMFLKLANLKNGGYGKDVSPKCMFSSGAMLDVYTKQYVEKAFGEKLFNIYATTEVGVVAFECHKGGSYHVNSDFVFVEFLDDENKPVLYGKPGNIVVTRLYGKATPIIRYSGLEDLVTPIKSKQDCGITSQMIGYIEGRKMDLVTLPDGRNIAPFHVTTIPATAMEKLNTFKIKQFQIIQHKVNEIEVLVIIDEKERNIGPSVETIFKEIKKLFKEKTSKEVNIIINEVDEIEKDVRSDHVKLLISKVKKNPKK